MSDRMAAEIWIGGKIPAALILEFCEAIASQGVSVEWGDADFRPTSAEDLLEACGEDAHGASVLWLCDEEAASGLFSTLERFLQEHRIAYSRRSEGKYEYDAELVEYRPDLGLVEMLTNAAGTPVVTVEPLEAVEKALDQAAALAQAGRLPAAFVHVEQARRALHEHLPAKVPPLPSFEIVAEPAVEMEVEVAHG